MKAAGYYKVVPLIAIIVCVSVFVLSLMEMKRVNKLSGEFSKTVSSRFSNRASGSQSLSDLTFSLGCTDCSLFLSLGFLFIKNVRVESSRACHGSVNTFSRLIFQTWRFSLAPTILYFVSG